MPPTSRPPTADHQPPPTAGHGLRLVRRLAALAMVGWTSLGVAMWLWETRQREGEAQRLAQAEAKAHLGREMALRLWIANRGGIYVRPDAQTPPNPYLSHPLRDVVTTDGMALTMVNASYLAKLLRQEDLAHIPGLRKRISSYAPLNPEHWPEDWEKTAYDTLMAGAEQHVGLITLDGREYFKLTRALRAEPACLKCHADRKEGDLLGALSILVDFSPYRASEIQRRQRELTAHAIVWLIGLAGIAFGAHSSINHLRLRQQSFKALSERQALFQTLAECSTDWVFWRNPEGSFRYVSPACETISGYRPDEFIDDPTLFTAIVHEDDRDAFHTRLSEANRLERPLNQEFRIRHRDGSVRYLVQNCRPIHDAHGVFLGLRGANRDITEKREQEQILINQSRHAAMGEMIGNIAHQWRQPITAVSLILQNLEYDYRDGVLDADALHAYVARAREHIDHMSSTIDDFRRFFRPESTPSRFEIAQPVEEALKIVRDSFQARGIGLQWTPGPALATFGYPNELVQVLLNLLTNARDAIVERGVAHGLVSIELRPLTASEALLAVRDNGGGIDPAVLPRIFDPYFTTKPEGTGIGLYMSAMLIDHMGGSLIASNVEGGTEFRIRLPLRRDEMT